MMISPATGRKFYINLHMKLLRRIRRLFRLKYILRFGAVVLLVWGVIVIGLGIHILNYGAMDNAEPSDVIIVLGSGLRRNGQPGDALLRRSLWASDLYQRGLAPAVICTGGIGLNQTRSEASACRDVLLAQGVPDEVIYLDEQSLSTEENAIYAQEIMDEQGWEFAILVTDSFHMLRADWIFNTEGVAHTRSPVPREQVRTKHFVRHFTREIFALHWQAFQDLFNLSVTRVPLF